MHKVKVYTLVVHAAALLLRGDVLIFGYCWVPW